MFLAIRDIRFAKGRFALMGGVVALITLLLVMLSGLTAGLAHQSTSAIEALPAGRIVFGAPSGAEAKASYTDSEISAAQLSLWQEKAGTPVEPLGISQGKVRTAGGAQGSERTANAAVFGSTGLAPIEVSSGDVALSQGIATALGVQPGGFVGISGRELRVSAVVPDEWYSHLAVVWTSLDDWRAMAQATLAPGAAAPAATVLVAENQGSRMPDAAAADSAAGTVSQERDASFQALGSFKSENGSLLLIQAFLYGISALVVSAFLAIWTVQRTRDIAVLKALGATQGYVFKDAIVQGGLVLTTGTVLGGGIGALGGWAAGHAVPFILSAVTVGAPVLGIVLLGLAGAAVAVRGITRIDPLLALGGN